MGAKRQIIWDGRDHWLIFQIERPENERAIRITQSELELMSWEDRLTAEAQVESDAWADQDQTVEQAVSLLRD